MRSPFPGMDPYLEDPAFWQDFHQSFITYCRDYLLDRLPDAYEARANERVRLVEASSDRERQLLPDVAVLREPRGPTTAQPSTGAGRGAATLEPVSIPMAVTAEVRDAWIEILHRPERSLVTVIELLSPTNKAGAGYGEYLAKRRAVLEQNANLVEIDLLKGGERVPFLRPLPAADYHVFVARQSRRPYADVYSWRVRDPLPTIPVPLRPPDGDVTVELATLVNQAYERGRYARYLRYDASPRAPLAPEDAAWAEETAKSMRPRGP
jgi:hypothetical protein